MSQDTVSSLVLIWAVTEFLDKIYANKVTPGGNYKDIEMGRKAFIYELVAISLLVYVLG